MIKLGFESSDMDPCLFVRRNHNSVILVILYLDDILLANPSDKLLAETSNNLSKKLKIKDLGSPEEFSGIKIERDLQKQVLKLSQTKFIEKMLY